MLVNGKNIKRIKHASDTRVSAIWHLCRARVLVQNQNCAQWNIVVIQEGSESYWNSSACRWHASPRGRSDVCTNSFYLRSDLRLGRLLVLWNKKMEVFVPWASIRPVLIHGSRLVSLCWRSPTGPASSLGREHNNTNPPTCWCRFCSHETLRFAHVTLHFSTNAYLNIPNFMSIHSYSLGG